MSSRTLPKFDSFIIQARKECTLNEGVGRVGWAWHEEGPGLGVANKRWTGRGWQGGGWK